MCSNPFWKQLWRVFGSVRSGDGDAHYLELELKSSEQLHEKLWQISKCEDNISVNDKLDKNFASTILASEEKEINVSSNVSMTAIRTADVVDNFQDNSILKGKSKDFPPLYQRVLSALIVVDESEEFDEAYGENEGPLNIIRSDFPPTIGHRKDDVDLDYDALLGLQKHEKSAPNNASCNRNNVNHQGAEHCRSLCNGEPLREDYGTRYKAREDYPGHIPHTPPFNCPDSQMQLEERLLLELHSIGLYPETMPDLLDEDEVINKELFAFNKGLNELVHKKKVYLRKVCEAIQEEKEQKGRCLEQHAMDRLTEVAYKKLLAARGSNSSKTGLAKISKQTAISFAKRTLARCHDFEASGKSCFSNSPIRDILAAHPCDTVAYSSHSTRLGFVLNGGEWCGSTETLPDQAFGRNGPIFNRGKKKEVLLDNVGANSLQASAALGSQLLGGAKGKRSERDRDGRNNSARGGRSSLGSSKGECQPKSKPKQKSSQHPTSGFPGGSAHNFMNVPAVVSADQKRNTGLSYPQTDLVEPTKNSKGQMELSNLPPHDLVEDLGVGTALSDHQDLDAWLNFDDDGLPDPDALDTLDLSGLEIPMDDLSDLNMIL